MDFTVSKNGITESLWNSSERITTPSIICSKNGSTYYIPLFSGDENAVITYNSYNYKLGKFKVSNLRAAIGREEAVVDIYVFSSDNTTWILTSKGDLYGCGSSYYGQQGSGTSGDSANVKTFTKRASNVKTVSCSGYTTWYIDNNNDLYGCGWNNYGQQGSGNTTDVTTFTKRASNVKEVSCSAWTTWYIDTSNNLYGCGSSYSGQQGSGASGWDAKILTFTKRASNVKKVSCSRDTTWYIDNNNNLYGCGANDYGQHGSGNTSDVLVFTKRAENVKEVSCSTDTTWYIDTSNNLYGCGSGFDGEQGSGTSSDDSANVKTFTKRASNVKKVSCSRDTTWYIDNNNNLYGCGANDYGQQGGGPYRVETFTKRAENVKEVSCTSNATWYIDTSNNLYGCGSNYNYQQGSGASSGSWENVRTFTKKAENVKEVSCSNSTTWYIDNNNNLYGCGYNYDGQQGSGTSGNSTEVKTFTKREL